MIRKDDGNAMNDQTVEEEEHQVSSVPQQNQGDGRSKVEDNLTVRNNHVERVIVRRQWEDETAM